MLTKLLLIAVLIIMLVLIREIDKEIEEDRQNWGWYCEDEEA